MVRASGLAGPLELLDLSDREIKTLVRRVCNYYVQQGKGTWARQVLITMKGFLESQDRRLELKRSERIRTPPRKKIAVEHVPSKQEVYDMAACSSPRNRAILLCLFQSGVRVGCLCNWTWALIQPQLDSGNTSTWRIRVTPNMDTKLNLYGLSYYVTGLRTEAVEALRYYVRRRMKSGWEPKPSDPIIVTEELPARRITRAAVWRVVKSSARAAGLNPESVWVHCLRKSFRKVLNATPQIDEDTKEALMGHKLPGSRGSYFDYHDEDEVMSKYSQADFSKATSLSENSTSAIAAG